MSNRNDLDAYLLEWAKSMALPEGLDRRIRSMTTDEDLSVEWWRGCFSPVSDILRLTLDAGPYLAGLSRSA